jgi:hypothetical protein
VDLLNQTTQARHCELASVAVRNYSCADFDYDALRVLNLLALS